MVEVEIFLRFSEISVEMNKRDVIQARGVSMSSLTWRDVVVKLLSNEAHVPMQKREQYVVKLIHENEMVKQLVFETFDKAVDRQLQQFVDLFDNTLASTFSNPWVFLKRASTALDSEPLEDVCLPSLE